MKKKTLLTLSLLCGLGVSVVACTQPGTPSSSSQEEIQNTNPCAEEDNKVHLILMAGQSGGRGKALVSDLSEEERTLKEYMLHEAMRTAADTAMENCGYQKVKK